MSKLRLGFVGDLALSSGVAGAVRRMLREATVPEFIERLRGYDLTFANVELPFFSERSSLSGVKEIAQPEDAALLKEMGVDVACLANNHIYDAGGEGIEETRNRLAELGIATFGAGDSLSSAFQPAVVEVQGLRVGFIGCADGKAYTHLHIAREDRAGAAPLDSAMICEAISGLRPNVDLVIFSMHQGVNYVHFATPRQRALAKEAIEAGADVVVGHHPHVLQGCEKVGDALVFYSIGEFLFDSGVGNVVEPKWEEARRLTAVLELQVVGSGVDGYSLYPYRRNDDFSLQPINDQERASFDEWFAEISDVYRNYSPDLYLRAAGKGVVSHALRVLWFNARAGNLKYLARSLTRIRYRHVQMLWAYLRILVRRLFDAKAM